MKQTLLLILILCLTTYKAWAQNNKITLAYIEQYKAIAMKEMKRTGVPASITLAQAIVESNSGESNLAKNHNNHFGIKCKSDWTGAKAYQDDDAKQECFRAYDSAELSFKDHSNFLKNRPNYVDLFLLDPVDDTAWAYGLKKAGYATAPDYPKKLLKIIDDYELAQYNFPELANEIDEEEASTKVLADAPVNKTPSDTIKVVETEVKSLNKPAGISQVTTASNLTLVTTKQLPTVQADTFKKEVIVTVQASQKESVRTDTTTVILPTEPTQPKYNYPEGRFRINQVPVILGKENMSFVEIAIKYNVPLYKLFEYNEIKESILLKRDQLIFLASKKKEGATSFHNVKYNTTLHEISQLEGIQLSLLKMYNPQLTDPVKDGTQVLLFKSKDNNQNIKKDNTLLFNKKNN
ncbi:MAG: glycoside hydrolase family 73 protein [Sediminibacterium sp.]